MDPLVPVTVTRYVPGGEFAPLKIKLAYAEEFTVKLTWVELKFSPRKPVGVAERVTVPEKPLILSRVIVDTPIAKGSLMPVLRITRDVGFAVTPKSPTVCVGHRLMRVIEAIE